MRKRWSDSKFLDNPDVLISRPNTSNNYWKSFFFFVSFFSRYLYLHALFPRKWNTNGTNELIPVTPISRNCTAATIFLNRK